MRTPWKQFAAWSCLVVVLLQGGAMSRGLVLCFEPDGAVNLETAAAGRDGEGCGEDCSAPSPLGDGVGDGADRRASDERGSCPCVDFAFVSCPDRIRLGDDPLRTLQCAHLVSLPTTFAWLDGLQHPAAFVPPPPPRGLVASLLVGSVVIRI